MPLYEYECQQCHRRTEKIQKFSDAELTVCPHCGGALERTVTAPAIQFKGAGWYKDLYSSAKPAAPQTGEAAASSSAGEGGTAPAAAAGKSETAAGKSEAAPAAANAPAASPTPSAGS